MNTISFPSEMLQCSPQEIHSQAMLGFTVQVLFVFTSQK